MKANSSPSWDTAITLSQACHRSVLSPALPPGGAARKSSGASPPARPGTHSETSRGGRSEDHRRDFFRPLRNTARVASALLLSFHTLLAADDLKSALQRGLFEEEANRNLPAAITAYQTLLTQFDKDRELAATALFRLGECYRKLEKTNDAIICYQRVLREFADVATLARLSQQNLAGLGVAASELTALQMEILALKREAAPGQAGVFSTAAPPGDRSLQTRLNDIQGLTPASEEDREIQRLQAMIKDSPDLINARAGGADNQTPLQTAAARGQARVVQFLLDNHADLELRNGEGRTALGIASYGGHKRVVELLLAKGANIEAADRAGNTPLALAVAQGYRAVAEVLLDHKANVNAASQTGATPLHTAVRKLSLPMAQLLIARGADVNAQDKLSNFIIQSARLGIERVYRDFGTPLHTASTLGHTGIVALLIAAKATVDARNQWGFTPLHHAVANGHLAVAAMLLEAGADPNTTGNEDVNPGWTPLHLAAQGASKEMTALLLQHKANPNAQTGTPFEGVGGPGWTPLLIAVKKDNKDLAELLLRNKADPNLGAGEMTPLWRAVAWPNRPMAELLLKHDANPNRGRIEDKPFLYQACLSRDLELASLLLAHGADANATNNNGWTALHLVVQTSVEEALPSAPSRLPPPSAVSAVPLLATTGPNAPSSLSPKGALMDLAKLLLAHKADVNQRDKDGKNPLNLLGVPARPATDTQRELVELLKKHGALDEMPEPPPDPQTIRFWRSGWLEGDVVFRKDTAGRNRFTLIEALLAYYRHYHGAVHTYEPMQNNSTPAIGRLNNPDLTRLVIRRPAGTNTVRIPVNLMLSPMDFDCSRDVQLEFGDVVEVPEREGPAALRIGAAAATQPGAPPIGSVTYSSINGLPAGQRQQLQRCAPWNVQFRVGDQISPAAPITLEAAQPGDDRYLSRTLARLATAGALPVSADLSKVKIIRRDPQTSETRTLEVDVLAFRNSGRPVHEDLLLRHGDLVEVPKQ